MSREKAYFVKMNKFTKKLGQVTLLLSDDYLNNRLWENSFVALIFHWVMVSIS